jgi:hypothetical protein
MTERASFDRQVPPEVVSVKDLSEATALTL